MRNSHFIEEERRYARKDWMKIRINDLTRNRVDGIERIDQVEREEKNDGSARRKRESGWTNLIYDKEQET